MNTNRMKGEATLIAGAQTYRLFFGTNAMVSLEDSLDMSFQEVGALLASGKARIKQMRLVLWSMLLEHHENVTEAEVGQIMDEAGHEAAGEAIGAAFVAAMPQAKGGETGDGEARPQTAAPAAKKTGKGSGKS